MRLYCAVMAVVAMIQGPIAFAAEIPKAPATTHHDISVDVECGPSKCQTDFTLQPGYTNVHVTCYGQDPISIGALMSCGSPNVVVSCVPTEIELKTPVKECDCQFPGPGKAKAHVSMTRCQPSSN